ncbi:hypothetical protein LJB71_01840 [Thermomonas sp. S9]|uniref:hypothetical protein n=1 Tax=Thermomonas sp. S9 TaxID=2885203 RepID=UPI00216AC507|nr:hypothetical protein [Thermomonas sp. S9]MCR6495112.1 hypothetical protein [Thermomonas sp. S9]
MKVEIIPVWKQVTPALTEEVVAFWRAHKAIADEAVARARAQELVCIARDKMGALCGVGTAVLKVLPRLRQPTYYYRQFFAPQLRGRGHILGFFRRCKQVLHDYNAGLKQPESLGLLLEIENPKIASAYKRAVEPGFDVVFIGYSPRGLQLRVSYFDDAVLQAPARISAPAALANGGRAARGKSGTPLPAAGAAAGSITTENAS